MHGQLLASCLARAAEEEGRDYFKRLLELARPWLARRILEQADRDILLDLYCQCQRIDRDLNGRDWHETARGAAPSAAFLVVVLVLTVLLVAGKDWVWDPLVNWAWNGWRVLMLAFSQSPLPRQLIVVSVIGIVIAVWVLSRATRS
jgi:hypothetical protein